MKKAAQILEEFKNQEVVEAHAYDHTEEERSHLFHTYGFDVATTEKEYIEFLYALVKLEKPRKLLESGTGSGITTLMLLAAMEECMNDFHEYSQKWNPLPRPEINYSPELYSVDTRYVKGVELMARKLQLSGWLNLISYETTLKFLEAQNVVREQGRRERDGWIPFDFCIFDSEQSVKAKEAEYALAHHQIAKNGLIVFHDTGLFHPLNGIGSDYLQHIAKLAEQYDLKYLPFPWSRGLIVMRYPGPNLHE